MFEPIKRYEFVQAIRWFFDLVHTATFDQVLRFGDAFENHILGKPELWSLKNRRRRLVKILRELASDSCPSSSPRILHFPKFTASPPLLTADRPIRPLLTRRPGDGTLWSGEIVRRAMDILDRQHDDHHRAAQAHGIELFTTADSELYDGEFEIQPAPLTRATTVRLVSIHLTELFLRMLSSEDKKLREAAMTFEPVSPADMRRIYRHSAPFVCRDARYTLDGITVDVSVATYGRATIIDGPDDRPSGFRPVGFYPLESFDLGRDRRVGHEIWSFGLEGLEPSEVTEGKHN